MAKGGNNEEKEGRNEEVKLAGEKNGNVYVGGRWWPSR